MLTFRSIISKCLKPGGLFVTKNNINGINLGCMNRAAYRPITIYLSPDDPDAERDMNQFAIRSELMGSDPYPHHRKEHFKRSAKRYNIQNKKIGRRANHKVRGLVDFINLKRMLRMR